MRTTPDPADATHMAAALALARRGLGRVWPNPAVGCVLVRDGRVVGRGWTQPGGRPHAETEALNRAGHAAKEATAYVTLEPCSHHGQTPPCCDALIAAGVARVVVAIKDPDPRVSGRGLAALEAAGIAVTLGVGAAEAEDVTAGFLSRVTRGRPLVTLKVATSLDGRIATATGHSQWITGPQARARGHRLRLENDAVLTGIGTVLADDPALTCRLPGAGDHSPVRVVLDSRLRLPPDSQLARTAATVPTWVLTAGAPEGMKRRPLEDLGVKVIPVAADGAGRVDPATALQALGEAGLTRLLVEAGAAVNGALLGAGLVDRLAWFRGGQVIGADGLAAVAACRVDALEGAPAFTLVEERGAGPDRFALYNKKE